MTGGQGPLCPDMPVKGAASQEHQAWILRRFLTQVERQEAAGEEEPHSITGEFAVSQVFVVFCVVEASKRGLKVQVITYSVSALNKQ